MIKENDGILVKISGEYLGKGDQIFNKPNIEKIAQSVSNLRVDTGRPVFLVVGGGNICRGRELTDFDFQDGGADHIGMISTVQNSIILKKVFDQKGYKTHVMAPFNAEQLQIHPYQPGKAKWWAGEQEHIVIFAGGLGLCGLTTDMTAVSRAYEVGAKIVIKVTDVGGLFTTDPKKDSNAKLIPKISHKEVLKKGYEVMDEEAFAFAKNKKIPISIISLDHFSERGFLEKNFGTMIGG